MTDNRTIMANSIVANFVLESYMRLFRFICSKNVNKSVCISHHINDVISGQLVVERKPARPTKVVAMVMLNGSTVWWVGLTSVFSNLVVHSRKGLKICWQCLGVVLSLARNCGQRNRLNFFFRQLQHHTITAPNWQRSMVVVTTQQSLFFSSKPYKYYSAIHIRFK